jgi:hypothetical protein
MRASARPATAASSAAACDDLLMEVIAPANWRPSDAAVHSLATLLLAVARDRLAAQQPAPPAANDARPNSPASRNGTAAPRRRRRKRCA